MSTSSSSSSSLDAETAQGFEALARVRSLHDAKALGQRGGPAVQQLMTMALRESRREDSPRLGALQCRAARRYLETLNGRGGEGGGGADEALAHFGACSALLTQAEATADETTMLQVALYVQLAVRHARHAGSLARLGSALLGFSFWWRDTRAQALPFTEAERREEPPQQQAQAGEHPKSGLEVLSSEVLALIASLTPTPLATLGNLRAGSRSLLDNAGGMGMDTLMASQAVAPVDASSLLGFNSALQQVDSLATVEGSLSLLAETGASSQAVQRETPVLLLLLRRDPLEAARRRAYAALAALMKASRTAVLGGAGQAESRSHRSAQLDRAVKNLDDFIQHAKLYHRVYRRELILELERQSSASSSSSPSSDTSLWRSTPQQPIPFGSVENFERNANRMLEHVRAQGGLHVAERIQPPVV